MLTGTRPFMRPGAPGGQHVEAGALAIFVAALTQLVLTTIWPGVRRIAFAKVSADSYFVVLLLVALCFIAAAWAERNVRTAAGAVCTAVGPAAWLGLLLWGTMRPFQHIAWFQPITLFTSAAAIAPLAGVASGWGTFLMRSNPPASLQQ
jgi:hypothetical protein